MNENAPITVIPESPWRQGLLLLLFIVIMLLLRIVPIHYLVFTSWPGIDGNFVNFAADDAVYQMRLLHNTLHHFPHRIFFDPFAYFPFGSQIHFGPFFTLIMALFALILGLGHPTPELINIVGAYAPPVMGALCLLPTFFIARKLFNSTSAIFAAYVLALLPGEFFQRSALGFTDNHVAEVLFSTTTLAFLIYALLSAETFNFKTKNWKEILLAKPLLLTYCAGFFFGIYVLNWAPSLFFGGIFFVFFILQLSINQLQNRAQNYLIYLAVPLYLIPTLMVLPYSLANPHFYFIYYSLTQPAFLLLMLGGIISCYGLASLYKRLKIRPWLFPLTLIALALVAITLAQQLIPTLYDFLIIGINLIFHPSVGFKTIAELRSGILDVYGHFSLNPLWFNLYWTIYFGGAAFLILCYRVIRWHKPGELLFCVWTLVVLISTIAELRFVYYLAINAALLSGYFAYLVFDFLLNIIPKNSMVLWLQKIAIIVFTIFFTFVIAMPILALTITRQLPSGPHLTREWYDCLMWLRTKTPDPQGKPINPDFDYAQGFYPIPKEIDKQFQYPASAYGVMAWWDYGHEIAYIAHRIPNANPFQQGVADADNQTGVAYFFTATDEATALKNLNTIGTRYIILNTETVFKFFDSVTLWANDKDGWKQYVKFVHLSPLTENKLYEIDTPKYYNSMLSKLFFQDCNTLSHIRLVYESSGQYSLYLHTVNTKSRVQQSNQGTIMTFKTFAPALEMYNHSKTPFWLDKDKTIYVYGVRYPIKNVKIFEKVKGATIIGTAPTGTKVSMTLQLATKYDRTFNYTVSTTAQNNQFVITVAYPTEKMQGKDYSYDITPLGKYQLTIGNKIVPISVSEQAVMAGEQINI